MKSDQQIPFLKLGLVGAWSLAIVQNPDVSQNIDVANHFTGGLIAGAGVCIFHKSGFFLKTLDFGLDCQWLPNGFYNEGTQVGIGMFCNFGV